MYSAITTQSLDLPVPMFVEASKVQKHLRPLVRLDGLAELDAYPGTLLDVIVESFPGREVMGNTLIRVCLAGSIISAILGAL